MSMLGLERIRGKDAKTIVEKLRRYDRDKYSTTRFRNHDTIKGIST